MLGAGKPSKPLFHSRHRVCFLGFRVRLLTASATSPCPAYPVYRGDPAHENSRVSGLTSQRFNVACFERLFVGEKKKGKIGKSCIAIGGIV